MRSPVAKEISKSVCKSNIFCIPCNTAAVFCEARFNKYPLFQRKYETLGMHTTKSYRFLWLREEK